MLSALLPFGWFLSLSKQQIEARMIVSSRAYVKVASGLGQLVHRLRRIVAFRPIKDAQRTLAIQEASEKRDVDLATV